MTHLPRLQVSTIVAVHNLAPEPCRLSIPLEIDDAAAYDDLFGGGRHELDGAELNVTLEGYACHWFRIQRDGQRITP